MSWPGLQSPHNSSCNDTSEVRADGSLPAQQHHQPHGIASHQMICAHTTALTNSCVACKADEAAQYLAAYKPSEHCERVFKTPGRTSEMLRMSLTDPPARHRPPTPCSLFSSPKPTNLPVVTMWASSRRGVSRLMGDGVNAVCSLNSISTPPFLTLRRRVTMRHPSAGARREHETSSSTRPPP
ncbi:hypothetical protein EDB85DRAFT_1972461 [Lactarius pseudohatsudake]|nr:hypothetical protein EDB85DRAFT_1972461 [Lactarius pseudohatsudake]